MQIKFWAVTPRYDPLKFLKTIFQGPQSEMHDLLRYFPKRIGSSFS